MMAQIAPYGKAVTAAIVAALTAILTGLDDGHISWSDGIAALIAFFVALGAVWAVPNKSKEV